MGFGFNLSERTLESEETHLMSELRRFVLLSICLRLTDSSDLIFTNSSKGEAVDRKRDLRLG